MIQLSIGPYIPIILLLILCILDSKKSRTSVLANVATLQENRKKPKTCTMPIRQQKLTVRTSVAWKHARNGFEFKQIGPSHGGGVQKLDIPKDLTIEGLTSMLVDLFFPGGVNAQQHLSAEDLEFSVCTFCGVEVAVRIGTFTFGQYAKEHSNPLRIYLHSWEKEESNTDSLPPLFGATSVTTSVSGKEGQVKIKIYRYIQSTKFSDSKFIMFFHSV